MIDEMRALLTADDSGEAMNRLADQFRGGRTVHDLLPVLDCRDGELVSLGAWVLSEIDVALYDEPGVLARLERLTEHEDPGVRFHAFAALYPVLDPGSTKLQVVIQRLLADPNSGVRGAAEAANAQAFVSPPELAGTSQRGTARLLGRRGGSDELASNVRARVIEVLELIACKRAQLDYQARASHVHVAHEIFNQWEDWYRPGRDDLSQSFSAQELDALRAFNEVFEDVSAATPTMLPGIEVFVATREWERYAEAARAALARVRRRVRRQG